MGVSANISQDADPGEGHITIDLGAFTVVQGTWLIELSVIDEHNMRLRSTSNAVNDEVTYKAYFAAGTYSMRVSGEEESDKGILEVRVDDVVAGTTDFYAAGQSQNNSSTHTGLVISTSGLYTIDCAVDSKNGASSGFQMRINNLSFWRTA